MGIKINHFWSCPYLIKKKIMVQLWGSLSSAIEDEFAKLHIKRDAYLNALFLREIDNLVEEMTFQNSDAVRIRINERKLPNRVKLTIELDAQFVEYMDEVLRNKNIPRNSFINRVLFFLIAKKSHLDQLDIRYERKLDAAINPLDGALGFLSNPFGPIRDANNGRFYTLACFPDAPFIPRGPNLFALNTGISIEDAKAMNIDTDDSTAGVDIFADGEVPLQEPTRPSASMAETFAGRRSRTPPKP